MVQKTNIPATYNLEDIKIGGRCLSFHINNDMCQFERPNLKNVIMCTTWERLTSSASQMYFLVNHSTSSTWALILHSTTFNITYIDYIQVMVYRPPRPNIRIRPLYRLIETIVSKAKYNNIRFILIGAFNLPGVDIEPWLITLLRRKPRTHFWNDSSFQSNRISRFSYTI